MSEQIANLMAEIGQLEDKVDELLDDRNKTIAYLKEAKSYLRPVVLETEKNPSTILVKVCSAAVCLNDALNLFRGVEE